MTVIRQKREASNPSPPSALTQGLTGLTGGLEVCSLNTLAIYDLPQSTITLEQPCGPLKWAEPNPNVALVFEVIYCHFAIKFKMQFI